MRREATAARIPEILSNLSTIDAAVPFHLVDHPLAHDALAELRDARTPPPAFRAAAHRISLIVAAEALRDLPTEADTVVTPIGPAGARIVRADVVIVPVLRAGLGMVDSILELVPRARVGHIGLQRDEETAAASRYYARLPPGLAASVVLLADPMLATGGSALAAVQLLHTRGCKDVRLLCMVAAPEGVERLHGEFPSVPIYAAALDRELDDRGYILPGLGDAGDRLFGTR
jgi:uracil phosphoribosyltransferase